MWLLGMEAPRPGCCRLSSSVAEALGKVPECCTERAAALDGPLKVPGMLVSLCEVRGSQRRARMEDLDKDHRSPPLFVLEPCLLQARAEHGRPGRPAEEGGAWADLRTCPDASIAGARTEPFAHPKERSGFHISMGRK